MAKIAFVITKFKPFGGVFTFVEKLRTLLIEKGNEVDIFVLGRNKGNYIFFNKTNPLKQLLEYDIVEIHQCWGKDTISEGLLNTFKELMNEDKLIFRIHDVKAIQSRSKTNYSDIVKELSNAVFWFHGEEEQKYFVNKFNLQKTVIIGHWSEDKVEGVDLKKKDKIIVTSRIDFCKGLEFIKDFIKSPYYKRRIEFYSKNINEKFVYFTNFDEILKFNSVEVEDKNYLDYVYRPAKIVLNFTWWGQGSGKRPELVVMEGWRYGVIPFVDSRWVQEEGVLKKDYNCVSIERGNFLQLYNKIEKVFTDKIYTSKLIEGGYKTLKLIKKEKDRFIDFYEVFKNKNYQSYLKRDLTFFL